MEVAGGCTINHYKTCESKNDRTAPPGDVSVEYSHRWRSGDTCEQMFPGVMREVTLWGGRWGFHISRQSQQRLEEIHC